MVEIGFVKATIPQLLRAVEGLKGIMIKRRRNWL